MGFEVFEYLNDIWLIINSKNAYQECHPTPSKKKWGGGGEDDKGVESLSKEIQ